MKEQGRRGIMTDVTQILNDTLGERGYESGKLEVDSSHLL